MLEKAPKNRWHAFGVHLLISLFLFIAMCIIIVVFWYPGVLFTTEGGWQGVRLIAGVDFIIGPMLTLIIYKAGKKSLKFDLTCIGIMQIACISYGMYVVHQSRPAIVGYGGIFYTVNVQSFHFYGNDLIADSDLLKQDYPIWANVKLPEEPKARRIAKIKFFSGGLKNALDKLEPYENALTYLPREGKSLKEARKEGIIIPDTLDSVNTRVFLLSTRYDDYQIAVNIETGEIVTLLDSAEAHKNNNTDKN